MIHPLFFVPMYCYEVQDWSRKKSALYKKMNRRNFEKKGLQEFYTDRQQDGRSYALDFDHLFSDELNQFKQEADIQEIQITDIWTIKYKKQDYQTVHNHRSHGYSGLLYVDYDEKVHKPTVFVGPWNDPVSDTTLLSFAPDAKEGMMYIFPSVLLHYAQSNRVGKERVVTSWDMLVR
tara:strand:+ start:488 stop:1018 length:531 start_codon:yes stop_codon:yes gene_type:complete